MTKEELKTKVAIKLKGTSVKNLYKVLPEILNEIIELMPESQDSPK